MGDGKNNFKGITSFTLHISAMIFMLLDHLWFLIFPNHIWLNIVGRFAFPIFSFLIVEGFYHTKNFTKYLIRLFIFALISEIPFNLFVGSEIIYPYYQNVLWTFLISLIVLWVIEKVKTENFSLIIKMLLIAVVCALSFAVSVFFNTDYNMYGVAMVLVFYFFRGGKWYFLAAQTVAFIYINCFWVDSLEYGYTVFNYKIYIPRQVFAVFALPIIWLYNGKQGFHNKGIKYLFYIFYPAHMLVLFLIKIVFQPFL